MVKESTGRTGRVCEREMGREGGEHESEQRRWGDVRVSREGGERWRWCGDFGCVRGEEGGGE